MTHKLTGREEAADRLRTLLQQAASGRPGVAFVTGEAGSGKTALIEQAARSFSGRTFIGRALPGGSLPLKPWLDIVRRLQESEANEPGRSWQALLKDDAFRLDDAGYENLVAGLLASGGGEPTLMVLEDLQHVDASSLEFLLRLADRLRGESVLITGTYRPEDVSRAHPLRRIRTQLRSVGKFEEIALGRLSPPAALALMEQRLGGEPNLLLAQRIHDGCQGNPLFLIEFCDLLLRERHLVQGSQGWELPPSARLPMPESIRDLFAQRLDVLGPTARRVLEAAAVIGTSFSLHELFRLEEDRAGLDALLDASWIEMQDDSSGRFRQTLARDAIVEEMTWSRRAHLHRRLAEILESEGAHPAEIAPHHLAGGDREGARGCLLAAAEQCCGLHAYDDAFRFFHQALDLWPPEAVDSGRTEALQRLAACAQSSGRLEEAAKAWREILDAAPEPDDPVGRGRAFRALATVLEQLGRFRPAIRAHQDAAACFEQAARPAEAAAAWFAAGQVLMCQALHKQGFDAFVRAGEWAEQAGDPGLRCSALGEAGVSAAMLGRTEEALPRIEQSLSLALENQLTDSAAEAYRRRAIVYDYLSDLPREKAAFQDAVRFCRTNGVREQEKLCLACMAYGLFRMGEWPESLTICREIMEDPNLDRLSKGLGQMTRGLIHVHRGEYRTAHASLSENSEAARSYGYVAGEFFTLWGLALMDEAEQRLRQAESRYRQLLDIWPSTDDRHDVLDPLCAAAFFFATHDRPADLQRCCQVAGQIAAETGNPEATAALACCLGARASSQDLFPEAMDHFRQALTGYERLALPVQVVSASERLLENAYAMGDAAAAAAYGRQGIAIARRLGMRPAIRRIDRLLSHCETSEEQSAESAPADFLPAQLTRRQREVADELARGLTNKDIAHRLRLSVRTVDMHVRHILERMNCRSRTEAIRLLMESSHQTPKA